VTVPTPTRYDQPYLTQGPAPREVDKKGEGHAIAACAETGASSDIS
jgi:hypothetical protein